MINRRAIPLIAFTLAFTSCIAFAYLWFNTDLGRSYSQLSTNNSRPLLWLQARTNIEGYTFIPEPVSDAVKETLGTTNIVSGTFYRTEDRSERSEVSGQNSVPTSALHPLTSGESALRLPASDLRKNSQLSTIDSQLPIRITVFLANWSAESKKPLLMLGHTPDICWTCSGWKPVNLGQPTQITIDIPIQERQETNDQRPKTKDSEVLGPWSLVSGPRHDSQPSTLNCFLVPFFCRAFESADQNGRELAVWCTLIDGQPLAESMKFWKRPVQAVGHDAQVRMNILDRLFQAARQRLPVRGKKQFVRYSIPIDGDWEATLERIKVVVPIWLQPALPSDLFL